MFNRKEYMKRWRINNRIKIKKYIKKYRKNNSEKIREQARKYHKNNLDKIEEYTKQWRKENHEKINKYNNEWCKNRRKVDLKYNFNNKIKNSIRKSLNKNKAGRHWEYLVGYTLEDLIKRLKKTMPEGYCWQDVLNGNLQIDHIIPISAYNFTKVTHADFKRCWALSNLQLLPTRENLIKSNKISRPFQPALKI